MKANVGAAVRDSQSDTPRATELPRPEQLPGAAVERPFALPASSLENACIHRTAFKCASVNTDRAGEATHREFEPILIAAFRHEIEVVVGTVEHVDATLVAGIGMEQLVPCRSCRTR